MLALFCILASCSVLALTLLVLRLQVKLDTTAPEFKQQPVLISLSITMLFVFSLLFGISTCKSETDTIKDYNKGLYQEKITYESIDGNIIPQDTVYIFKK